jgi:serine protease Do
MRAAGPALLALSVIVSALPAAEPTKEDLTKDELRRLEKKLQQANRTAGSSVACVVVSRSDRYPKPAAGDPPGKLGGFDRAAFEKANPTERRLAQALDLTRPDNIPDHGSACGVVIDAAGLVLTPYHVIDGATKVYVYLAGGSGSYADVHAADARYDLAVLKLLTPPDKLVPLKYGAARWAPLNGTDKKLVTKGKLVLLTATEYVPGQGFDGAGVALGEVTNVIRQREPGKEEQKTVSDSYYNFGPFILYDAKLNAGASGAALLNLDGELIGLTTTAAVIGSDRGPSYAFPTDDNFERVVDVLRRGEEVDYGYLGVRLPTREERTAPGGTPHIRIVEVVSKGPASLARLQSGDVITEINGIPVNTYEDLLFYIGTALADSKVELRIARAGANPATFTRTVTLGKLKHDRPVIASVRPEPVFGLRVDYGSILAQAGGAGVPAGVCVRDLVPNSPAAAAFKKLGDPPTRWLVTQVNGTPVTSPAEFYKAAKGQPTVRLSVLDPSDTKESVYEVTLP